MSTSEMWIGPFLRGDEGKADQWRQAHRASDEHLFLMSSKTKQVCKFKHEQRQVC